MPVWAKLPNAVTGLTWILKSLARCQGERNFRTKGVSQMTGVFAIVTILGLLSDLQTPTTTTTSTAFILPTAACESVQNRVGSPNYVSTPVPSENPLLLLLPQSLELPFACKDVGV